MVLSTLRRSDKGTGGVLRGRGPRTVRSERKRRWRAESTGRPELSGVLDASRPAIPATSPSNPRQRAVARPPPRNAVSPRWPRAGLSAGGRPDSTPDSVASATASHALRNLDPTRGAATGKHKGNDRRGPETQTLLFGVSREATARSEGAPLSGSGRREGPGA